MQDSSTASVYKGVIDDVITRVKPEVVQEGIDEGVLDELRLLWESKLQRTGVLDPEPTPILPSYGASAPGTSYLRQMPTMYPANQHLLPPLPRVLSSLPNLSSQPGYPSAQHSNYTTPVMGAPQPHAFQSLPDATFPGMPALPTGGQGVLSTSMQQLAGLYTAHANGVAGGSSGSAQPPAANGGAVGQASMGVPLNHNVDRKRKAEEMLAALSRPAERQQGATSAPVAAAAGAAAASSIPQQDGQDDGKDDVEPNKEEDEDNLSDVSSDKEEDEQIANVVVAQFDKVSHVKTKWKCQLKDGIMHVNGRDYLFRSAQGDMQF